MLKVQKALMAHLRGQAPLQAWLGDPVRIYDEAPKPVSWPYVVFGRATAQGIGGVGVDLDEQTLTLVCVSRFAGTEEVKGLAGAISEAIDGAEVALDGAWLVSVRVVFIDVFRGADLKTVYGLVRLRAVTEPL